MTTRLNNAGFLPWPGLVQTKCAIKVLCQLITLINNKCIHNKSISELPLLSLQCSAPYIIGLSPFSYYLLRERGGHVQMETNLGQYVVPDCRNNI